MKVELSTLELILLCHALGCYRGVSGYRKNRKELRKEMRDLHLRLSAIEIGQPDGGMIGTACPKLKELMP